jgi:hypothetical protein
MPDNWEVCGSILTDEILLGFTLSLFLQYILMEPICSVFYGIEKTFIGFNPF